jgi:hypothetical protein
MENTMKKINLELGAVVEFKFEGGVDTGVLQDKGVYQAQIGTTVTEDGVDKDVTVSVPYKDVLALVG